jgi:hypothetical protein
MGSKTKMKITFKNDDSQNLNEDWARTSFPVLGSLKNASRQ